MFIYSNTSGRICPWVMVSWTMLWTKLLSLTNLVCITKALCEISANFYFPTNFLKIYFFIILIMCIVCLHLGVCMWMQMPSGTWHTEYSWQENYKQSSHLTWVLVSEMGSSNRDPSAALVLGLKTHRTTFSENKDSDCDDT